MRKMISIIICTVMFGTILSCGIIYSGGALSGPVIISNLEQITTHTSVDVDPSWSPDGGKIVFESERGGSRDIWVMNSDGTNPVQLTSWPERERFPKFSPDGTKIAFMRGYLPHYDIWVMDSDGSNPVQLTSHFADDRMPCWTPDGSRLVFETHRTGNGDIWIMNSDGTNKVPLTTDPSRDAHPDLSLDGSKIVFQSDRTGQFEIWTMDFDGSNQSQITYDASSSAYNVCPAWSGDGTMIVYSRGYGYECDIWLMNSDGTNKQQLTTEPGDDRTASWNPVEDKIAFRSKRSGNYDIWVMTLNFSIAPEIDIDPDTLNLKSRGNWITCYIELPGCDVKEIDATTVLLEDALPPVLDEKYGFVKSEDSYIMDHDGDGEPERMLKFDRVDVEDMLLPGIYNLKVSGQLFDGTYFEGYSDEIRVIDPP
jgi:TolB protein